MTDLAPQTVSPVDRAPRRRWIPRLIVGLLGIVLLFWYGSIRVSSGPDEGVELTGLVEPVRVMTPRMRVGTFNIHGGRGLTGPIDLDRTAAALAGVDLAGLNEVHGAYFWESTDQAESLGRRLELRWLFAPTEQRWWHYGFGNGVVSRLPIPFWQRIPLERRHARGFRNLILLGVELAGQRVHVVVTHVERGHTGERAEQLRAISAFFTSLQPPAILLGDLNSRRGDAPLAPLLARADVVDALAVGDDPHADERIDWILLRGLRSTAAGIVQNGASDHPYYWADVEVVE